MPAEIEVISAGAGTGKTYTITEALRAAIEGGVRADAVIATTFTKKAAAELVERARRRLLAAGRTEDAGLIGDSYIGTVHSICGQMLQDFALEAGLSPALTVLPDSDAPSLFRTAAGAVIKRFAPEIEPIATRLSQLGEGPIWNPCPDWRKVVQRIADQARNNLIGAEGLRQSANRSIASLNRLLPEPIADLDGDAFDQSLVELVRRTLANPPKPGPTGRLAGTQDGLDRLQEILTEIERSRIVRYSHWAACARLKFPKTDASAFAPLQDFAAGHIRHPRLKQDLARYVQLCFECAAEAMDAFAAAKRRNGLIDFIDQECEVHRLLEREDVCGALRERFDLLVVDEFQDTSPIQLALFMKAATCVKQAVWVGDQKQAVYGFRGTDPDLMDAVIRTLGQRNGRVLDVSRRSRPDLVRLANWLFTPTFGAIGIPPERVRLAAHRGNQEGHTAAVHMWRLDGKKEEERVNAIATGIVQLLTRTPAIQVEDPHTGRMRPARPGDLLVLGRSNHFCERVAAALAAKGLRVAIERPDLLAQPECRFAVAALRHLVDSDDTLAVAEMLNLTETTDDGAWLRAWIGQDPPPWKTDPRIVRLDSERSRLLELTPEETLDVAISVAEAAATALRWSAPTQRLANLDALRALAVQFQDHCRAQRSAATAAGFIAYLDDVVPELEDGDRQPRAAGADAVSVMTYHKAKGLEAPIVILTQLDSAKEPRIWEPHVIARDGDFDPQAPLAGRWIRLWPWPYGMHATNLHLDGAAMASSEYADLAEKSRREETRLLYVGVTRARDYLVLAGVPGKTAWLDLLIDGGTAPRPLFQWPDAGSLEIATDSGPISIECANVTPSNYARIEAPQRVFSRPLSGRRVAFPPARLVPSAAGTVVDGVQHQVLTLGPRLPLNGAPDMERLGNALHDYFAAEARCLDDAARMSLASDLLARWDVANALQPTDLVGAGQRLTTFLIDLFPQSALRREMPVHQRADGREMYGQIDLLIAGADRFAVLDHKSFPGNKEQAVVRALRHYGQLAHYANATEAAVGQPVTDLLIHLPVVGLVIRFTPSAARRQLTA
jgi:ATP-dependent helicase/nuclease subunit A